MHAPMIRTLAALSAAVSICAAPASAGSQVFSESSFAPGSYSVQLVEGGSGGSSFLSQRASGNPAPSLSVRHGTPSGSPAGGYCASWIWSFIFIDGATADPAALGAVGSIDFSIDSQLISSSPEGLLQSQTPAIRQNGKLYISTNGSSVTPGGSQWSTTTLNDLSAGDFAEVVNLPPCQFTDPMSHPDFSANGSPIELGFARGNSTSVGGSPISASIDFAADNWMMTVHGCGLRIDSPPPSSATCATGLAMFSVSASADAGGAFAYQWQIETSPGTWQTFSGSPIPLSCAPGAFAFATTFAAPSVGIGIQNCAGSFNIRCLVSNACGGITSTPATLTISNCAGDANADFTVGLPDVAAIINCWAQPASCNECADLNGSGAVDLGDLAEVVVRWGTVCGP